MRCSAGLALFAFASLGVGPAAAQFDDQPPVLRRRDPASQSPTGFPSIGKKKDKSSKADEDPNAVKATGVISQITSRTITVEAKDTRIITCNILNSTEFLKTDGNLKIADLKPGMRVRIQATPNTDGEQLDATVIELLSSPTTKASAEEGEAPEDLQSILKDVPADDEDRPVLRRGVPSKKKTAAKADDDEAPPAARKADKPVTVASAARPEADDDAAPSAPAAELSPAMKLLKQAEENTAAFTNHLPNFVVQQLTTRYSRESKIAGWNAEDTVTATVTFVDGKEDYANIRVGNHLEKKGMMDIKGQRSTGEFGSALDSIMDPRSETEWTFVKDTELRRQRANVYDYKIKRENSQWSVKMGGQLILPGYSGRIWVARDSARVLRIEMKADDIPEAFPNDVLEETVDYDFTNIGNRKVLVPVESENLGCQRGSSFCARNHIEFRNYKEFRGESTIDFEK